MYDSGQDRCTSLASSPPVLQTCHESRSEAMRIYKKSFGTKSHEPRIWFCHENDTLYLPRGRLMGYDDDLRSFAELVLDTHDIVNLAIDHILPSIRRPWETYNKYILMRSFPMVHEVVLVLNPTSTEEKDYHGDMGFDDPRCDLLEVSRLLSDVRDSFAFELGTVRKVDEKDEGVMEVPNLPPIILKSKVLPIAPSTR